MQYSADELLQIATELEKRGRIFYESFAEGCGEPNLASLATSLARCEQDHVATFERMRQRLPEAKKGEALSGKALETAVTGIRNQILPTPRAVYQAVMTSDLQKTLQLAIDMENHAVDFYTDITPLFPEEDRAILNAIVIEEKRHLKDLLQARDLLKQGPEAEDSKAS